jgi:hypothetical protein
MAVDMKLGDTATPGPPRKLFDLDLTFGDFGYEVSGDGQRFLVSRQRQSELPNTPITVVLNWWVDFARQPAARELSAR